MSLLVYKTAFYRTKNRSEEQHFQLTLDMVEAAGLTPTNTSPNAGGSYAYAFVSAFSL